MTIALALLFAASTVVSDTTLTAADCPGGQRLAQKEIESSGAVHLADLLNMFDGIRTMTVSGYAWEIAHTGGIPFQGNGFAVLLDGEPVSVEVFGEQDLDLLPIPLMDIASITLCLDPGIAAGRFRSRGTLRIVTVQASQGIAVHGAQQAGNETGDPGPYLFTEPSPNIPRIGPDDEFSGSYRAGETLIRLERRQLRFYPTDPASVRRVQEVTTRDPPWRVPRTAAIRTQFPALGGVIAANALGRYVADLWFLEAAGRELPVRQLGFGGSLHGRNSFSSDSLTQLGLDYRVSLNVLSLDAQASELADFDPAWRQSRLLASAQFRARRGARTLEVGGAVERVEGSAPGLTQGTGFTLATLFAQRVHSPVAGLRQRTDFALVTASGVFRVKLANTFAWKSGTQTLTLFVGLDGQLPEERPGISYWHAQGYRNLLIPAVTYMQTRQPGPSTEYSARFGWRATIRPGLVANASVGGRMLRGLTIDQPTFSLNPGQAAVHGTVTVVDDVRGETAAGTVSLVGERGFWRGRVAYSLLTDIGGDTSFRQIWGRVPTHRARVEATFHPVPSFSIHAAFTLLSGAHWVGYEGVEGISVPPWGHFNYAEVPSHALLDAAVSKHLWNRRLRAILSFRNILDVEERYHPIGASLAFRLFVRIEARLGG